jgi:hypothetical protein
VINQCLYFNHQLIAKNFYYFDEWECDVLSLNRSDFTTEFEVKRSRSDFLADFNKKEKHFQTSNGYGCNYFYYACPIGLIKAQELPEYCGLIYCNNKGSYIVKKAPILHKETVTFNQLKKIAHKIMISKYV